MLDNQHLTDSVKWNPQVCLLCPWET